MFLIFCTPLPSPCSIKSRGKNKIMAKWHALRESGHHERILTSGRPSHHCSSVIYPKSSISTPHAYSFSRSFHPSAKFRRLPKMSTSMTITSQRVATSRSNASSSLLRINDRLSTTTTTTSSLQKRIPVGSWDSHMHVVDPEKYPLASTAAYTPKAHSLEQAMSFESTVGLSNIVLVQPSIYGNDNSCLLAALKELGPKRSRGVVGFDPKSIDTMTLAKWHAMGVRGVRYNLKSVGRTVSEEDLKVELQQYANIIRPLGWVLELFIGMETMPFLESIMPTLNVPVCLAHFASPTLSKDSTSPYSVPGFGSLITLLKQGTVYVKISAPYRLSTEREHRDLEPLAKEMIRVAGRTRLMFATDWPHTRFDGIDIKPFAERCLDWCGDDEFMVERLFKGNAEELWGVHRDKYSSSSKSI